MREKTIAASTATPPGAAAAPSPATFGSTWMRRLLTRIEGGACAAGEPPESRLRKVQFTFAAILVVPAGILWGVAYWLGGEPGPALIPLAYSAISLAGVTLLLRTGRFERFRFTQQISILVLPVMLQLALGGFVGAAGVIIWSFLAVVLALLFGGEREARAWFTAFAIAVLAATAAQPSMTVDNALPAAMVRWFFAVNLVTVAGVVFVVLYSFLADRRKLRALERAYIDQELALRQSEKLATLGTLAAGMAHELNNAATAATRGVNDLRAAIRDLHGLVFDVDAAISPEYADAAMRARSLLEPSDSPLAALTPIERTERVDDVDDWLSELGVGGRGGPAAEALVARGFTRDKLELASQDLALTARPLFAPCLASAVGTDSLIDEVARSVARVSDVVESMRSYTYLDRGTEHDVDVVTGLEDTLLVLLGDTKGGGAQVRREYADVPTIQGNGSQLNQVWTHLIQNALDAMGQDGTLTLRVRQANGDVVVEVEDDGPGMAPDVAARAFDPFFTTKPPGAGTGLGLAVTHKIVVRDHGGRIDVTSEPGRTVFTVTLPAIAFRQAPPTDA